MQMVRGFIGTSLSFIIKAQMANNSFRIEKAY